MTTYLICLGAYLTGWVIAQSIFLRFLNAAVNNKAKVKMLRNEWEKQLVQAIADELDRREAAKAAQRPGGHDDSR